MGIRNWLNKRKIDGSRFSFMEFKEDWDYENSIWRDKFTLGFYSIKNYISVNPDYVSEKNIEEICAVISHEFLHMLLRWEHGEDECLKLDNICPNTDSAWTDCGGL